MILVTKISDQTRVCVCVLCVVIPFIMDVRLWTYQPGSHRILHLPSAVLALTFLARRNQSFLSLVDREVEFCVLTISSFSHLLGILLSYFVRKNPSSCDDTEIRTYVPTS